MKEITIELDKEILGPAAIDAINIFCREVLIPRGLLGEDQWGSEEILREKYRVADAVCEKWKTCVLNE